MIVQVTVSREELARATKDSSVLSLGSIPAGATILGGLDCWTLADDVIVCTYQVADDPPPTISIGVCGARN